ncbi:MAG: serine/threonine-protein phosphatase [Peptococcaceae bacterium]|nr:serine/threonine-protein phosphatase [Peptococcaceae bacterium]
MKVSFAARSDASRVRDNNEDNLYCAGVTLTPKTRSVPLTLDGKIKTPSLFAVFDGMGGIADGEFASLTAAQTLSDHNADITTASSQEEITAAVQQYVAKTNKLLCEAMREKATRLGTTLALIVISETTIMPYNLGDSRIYIFSEDTLRQVSVDHTLSAQKVKLGILTPEQALSDRDRHTLSVYLGILEDEFSVMAEELPPIPRKPGQRILLCSDGLTETMTDAEIEAVMRSAKTVTAAASQLLELSLKDGGKDNVTCIVVGT